MVARVKKVTPAKPEPKPLSFSRERLEALGRGEPPANCAEGQLLDYLMTRVFALNHEHFQVGDLVVLKSGGHLMVVCQLDCSSSPLSTIGVHWSHKGTVQTDDIVRGALRKANAEDILNASRQDDIPF